MAKLFANSGDHDQTPHSAASDLGLHCLPITLLRVSQLQWVKGNTSPGLINILWLKKQPLAEKLVWVRNLDFGLKQNLAKFASPSSSQ